MRVDPEKVFEQVEADRAGGELSENVTTATIVYQASVQPGVIERINRETGERTLGTWRNGAFRPLSDGA